MLKIQIKFYAVEKTGFGYPPMMKLARDTAYWPSEEPVVAVGRPDARATEAEEVSIITIDDRTGPVGAARCCIVQRATVDVAGPHKVVWIGA